MARRSGVFRVLLISLAPHAHTSLVRAFERTGAVVLTASDPARAVTLLRWSPELVLVDLALGAGLTPTLVAALNAGRSRSSVLALHEGRLEDGKDDAAELSVDGFCRAADLIPYGGSASSAPALSTHSIH
jgi:DNA-binding response OmpR family regulator